MPPLKLFIPICKIDEARRLVYVTLSEEVRDKSDEILDYATAKPAFEKWSNEIKEASGGKSLGNVRAMHGSERLCIYVFEERPKSRSVLRLIDSLAQSGKQHKLALLAEKRAPPLPEQ